MLSKNLDINKIKKNNRYILIVAFLLICSTLLFTNNSSEADKSQTGFTEENLQSNSSIARPNYPEMIVRVTILTLIASLMAYFFIKYYRKKIDPLGTASNIEILGKHYINSKQHLLLIRVEDRKLMLGVSDSSINYITELSNKAEDKKIKKNKNQFKDVLNKLDPN